MGYISALKILHCILIALVTYLFILINAKIMLEFYLLDLGRLFHTVVQDCIILVN